MFVLQSSEPVLIFSSLPIVIHFGKVLGIFKIWLFRNPLGCNTRAISIKCLHFWDEKGLYFNFRRGLERFYTGRDLKPNISVRLYFFLRQRKYRFEKMVTEIITTAVRVFRLKERTPNFCFPVMSTKSYTTSQLEGVGWPLDTRWIFSCCCELLSSMNWKSQALLDKFKRCLFLWWCFRSRLAVKDWLQALQVKITSGEGWRLCFLSYVYPGFVSTCNVLK